MTWHFTNHIKQSRTSQFLVSGLFPKKRKKWGRVGGVRGGEDLGGVQEGEILTII